MDALGNAPIHYACQWLEPHQHIMSAELLALWPPAAKIANRQGLLPLHFAVRNGGASSVKLVDLLLDTYPESVGALDVQKMLPLHHVCCNVSGYALQIAMALMAQNEEQVKN